jgi:hypothetical protein
MLPGVLAGVPGLVPVSAGAVAGVSVAPAASSARTNDVDASPQDPAYCRLAGGAWRFMAAGGRTGAHRRCRRAEDKTL